MNARGVDVRLIGNPRLVVDGGELRGRSERSAAVLARLAIDAGSVVSRDLLLHDVWGGQRLKSGSGALRTQIRRLRSALDEAGIGDIVQTAPEGYVLDVERDAVDVHRAQDMLDAALAGDDGTTKTELIQSVWGMLDGDPFLGLEDFPFRLPDRARIDALKETARIELARSAMISGDPQIAVSVLVSTDETSSADGDGQALLQTQTNAQAAERFSADNDPHELDPPEAPNTPRTSMMVTSCGPRSTTVRARKTRWPRALTMAGVARRPAVT